MYCAWRLNSDVDRGRLASRYCLVAEFESGCRQKSRRTSAIFWAIIHRWPDLFPGLKRRAQFIISLTAQLAASWLAVRSEENHAPIVADDGMGRELLKLRQALQASGEAIFLTDRSGIISYVNPEFTRLYGYDFQEVVGVKTPRVLKSGVMSDQAYVEFWETLLSKQICKSEIVNRGKDGRLVTVESSANAVVNQEGKIIGFLAIQRDITERKLAEKELRQRNRELAILNTVAEAVSRSLEIGQVLDNALAEVLGLDIFEADAKGMVFLLDDQQGHLSLVAHQGAPVDHPCISKPVALGECLCGLAALHGQMIVSDESKRDKRHTRCPNISNHKDICLPLKAHGRVLGVLSLRIPATITVAKSDHQLLNSLAEQIAMAVENARLFEAVSQQRRHLKVLAARSAEIEEAERRRLSRELHDQVGQNLSAIGLNLTIIRTMIASDEPSAAYSRLHDTQALVEHITEQIRDLMVELRPPVLDDYGLLTALEWYGDQIHSRTGLLVRVSGNERDTRLPPAAEIALFRIAQEALSNVVKHAQATQVSITLDIESDAARLTVKDDGRGFNSQHHDSLQSDSGWGRFIMIERAEALGGHCHVESEADSEGTLVVVEVPR
jgi:PAS domain S-box-containing protein